MSGEIERPSDMGPDMKRFLRSAAAALLSSCARGRCCIILLRWVGVVVDLVVDLDGS